MTSQQKVRELMAQFQLEIFGMIPKAIRTCDEILGSDNLHLKAKIIPELPKLQELCKTCAEQTAETVNAVSPKVARRARRREVFADFMEMAVDKNQRYEMHDPVLDAIERDFEEKEGLVESRQLLEGKGPSST